MSECILHWSLIHLECANCYVIYVTFEVSVCFIQAAKQKNIIKGRSIGKEKHGNSRKAKYKPLGCDFRMPIKLQDRPVISAYVIIQSCNPHSTLFSSTHGIIRHISQRCMKFQFVRIISSNSYHEIRSVTGP